MTFSILFVLIAWASDCNHPELNQGAQAAFKVWGFHVYDIEYKYRKGYPDGVYALELQYKRDIQGHKIVETTKKEIARLGLGGEKLDSWIGQLGKIIPNVKSGDRLIGFVDEKKRSKFCFAGQTIGTIEDPQFADAFFGIWLNEKTSEPRLREKLLATSEKEKNANNK